jgi:hypothetical protein
MQLYRLCVPLSEFPSQVESSAQHALANEIHVLALQEATFLMVNFVDEPA